MRRVIGFVVAAAMLLACGGGTEAFSASPDIEREPPAADAPVTDLVGGFNDAGLGLLAEQLIDENLVLSPLSIGHALLMARAAADERTGAAIDAAFGLPVGAHEAWNAVDQAIAASAEAEDEVTVTVADRIWPRTGIQPDQQWLDLLASLHGVDVEALDFAGDPDGSRRIINDWVADRTDDLIDELLPEGFVVPETVLVLTDAVYFEAQWQTVFGKYGPVDGEFTLLDGSTVPTEFMQERELADRRGTGDGFVGAEIPYTGFEFSMLVIVPDEGRFDEIRSSLDQELLDEIDSTWTEGPFELLIPRWDTTTDLDLVPWLTELGAAPGSYPGISPDAFLDGAVHGADIAVDESGTVAAAATALAFLESGGGQPELTVAADRPFLYLIRHRPTGMVLFAGQVVDPR